MAVVIGVSDVYDINRSRSRVRVNIHSLSDEKKCGGMTTYSVTLFHVGGRSVAEERFGLFTKGWMNFICVALYTCSSVGRVLQS